MSNSGSIYIDGEIQRIRGPVDYVDLPYSGLSNWQPVLLPSNIVVGWDPRIGRWVPFFLRNYSIVTELDAATYVAGAPPAGWAEVIPAGCSITTQAGSQAWLQVAGLTAPQDFFFRAVAPGIAGNAITVQVEVTADVGLLVALVGTAIRFYGDAVLTSDRAAYQALIAATPAVAALITLDSLATTNLLAAVCAPTPLTYGTATPEIVIDTQGNITDGLGVYLFCAAPAPGDDAAVCMWGYAWHPTCMLSSGALNANVGVLIDRGAGQRADRLLLARRGSYGMNYRVVSASNQNVLPGVFTPGSMLALDQPATGHARAHEMRLARVMTNVQGADGSAAFVHVQAINITNTARVSLHVQYLVLYQR